MGRSLGGEEQEEQKQGQERRRSVMRLPREGMFEGDLQGVREATSGTKEVEGSKRVPELARWERRSK